MVGGGGGGEFMEHKMCVWIFATTSIGNISCSQKIKPDINIMYTDLHVKDPFSRRIVTLILLTWKMW